MSRVRKANAQNAHRLLNKWHATRQGTLADILNFPPETASAAAQALADVVELIKIAEFDDQLAAFA